jgi:hypothetical protein
VIVYMIAPLMLSGQAETVAATRDWRVEIPVSGKALAIGRVAADFGIDQTQQYALDAIRRWDADLDPSAPIEAGDTLVFSATESGVTALWGSPLFGLAEQRLYRVSAGSGASGTVRDFETDGGIHVIAARTTGPLRDTEVRPGATAFVTTPSKSLLVDQPDVAIFEKAAGLSPQPAKTVFALAILIAVIVSASFGLLAVELASLTGAVLMVVTGILTPKSAVRALDWNVLFILVGSVALGAIVVESGLATVLADAIRHLAGGSVLLVVIVFAADDGDRDQPRHQCSSCIHPHPGGDRHSQRTRHQPGDAPGADRHLHLVHLHQPVQPPVEPDGHAAWRLHLGLVRQVRYPAGRRIAGDGRYRQLPAAAPANAVLVPA